MSFFRETLWSTQDGEFKLADTVVRDILIADTTFNPKGKSKITKKMVKTSTSFNADDFYGRTDINTFNELSAFNFSSCPTFRESSISSLTLPSKGTSIPNFAFYSTTNLETVVIPNSYTTLGECLFASSSVKNVTFPNSITYIPPAAFDNNQAVTNVTLPSNVTELKLKVFCNAHNLESVNLDNITTFGTEEFKQCWNLNTVTLNNAVTELPYSCFRECNSLTISSLPSNLKTIGNSCFEGCSNLVMNTLPSGVETIGNAAFQGCNSLNLTSLPDSVKTIGYAAFRSDTTSIHPSKINTIPANVTSLGQWAFSHNEDPAGYGVITLLPDNKIESTVGQFGDYGTVFPADTIFLVNTEDLVDEYYADEHWTLADDNYAFCLSGHINFADPNVKNVLTASDHADYNGDGEIDYWEAYKCTALETASTDESGNTTYTPWFKDSAITEFTEFKNFVNVKEIKNCDWFEGCTSLSSIEFPDSLTSISVNCLANTCITTLDLKNISNLWAYLPKTVKTLIVRTPFDAENSSTFRECNKIENVYVYGSIDTWLSSAGTIGTRDSSSANLYLNDTLVTEVTVPSTYNKISSFPKFSHITSFTIPSTVTTLPDYAFSLNSAVDRTFTFEDASTITRVGSLAFLNNSASFSNDLFSNMTTVYGEAFEGCTGLPTNLSLPKLTTLGGGAFSKTNIETVTLNKVTTIPYSAFNECKNLTTVIAPNVVTLATFAFRECTNLTSIDIDFDNLKGEIGSEAFSGCSNFEWASGKELPEGVTSIGASTFLNCAKIAFSTLPSTVTKIYQHAFEGTTCTFTALPDGLQTLMYGAFINCSTVNISVIPEGVTTIYNRCLYGTAATSIEIKCPTKVATAIGSWGSDWCPFPDNCVIKVATAELKAAYEADATWQIGMTNHGYTFAVV